MIRCSRSRSCSSKHHHITISPHDRRASTHDGKSWRATALSRVTHSPLTESKYTPKTWRFEVAKTTRLWPAHSILTLISHQMPLWAYIEAVVHPRCCAKSTNRSQVQNPPKVEALSYRMAPKPSTANSLDIGPSQLCMV